MVEPGPPGSVQRIAEQPQFLQDTFQQLTQLFRGGGGTPNDIVSALERASARITEKEKAATDAEHELATRDASDQEKRFKNLEEQLDALLNPPKEKAPTTFAGTPLGPGPGGTPLDAEGQLSQLIASAAARPERFQAPTTFAGTSTGPGPGGTKFDSEAALARLTGEDAPPDPITDEDDFFAHGGRLDDSTAIVGEEGPELLIANPGARVIPIKGGAAKLKAKLGIPGLAHGGTVGVDVNPFIREFVLANGLLPTFSDFFEHGETLSEADFQAEIRTALSDPEISGALQLLEVPTRPGQPARVAQAPEAPPEDVFGVQQVLRGGSLEPTRRRLSTAAGLPVLSAQSRQRLLPSERDTLDTMRKLAGISREDFEQEQRSAVPGARVSGAGRLAARVAR